MEDIRIERIIEPQNIVHIKEVEKNDKIKPELKQTGSENNFTKIEDSFAPEVDLDKLLEKANQMADKSNKEITFKLDTEGNPPVIVVSDKETGKVIRQIPSEEMIRLNDKMEDYIGLIFNRRY